MAEGPQPPTPPVELPRSPHPSSTAFPTPAPTSKSSSHRLPTLSATQALTSTDDTSNHDSDPIPLNLPTLDALLSSSSSTSFFSSHIPPNKQTHGLPRGQLTELHGPPGSGKTTLALVAAAGALRRGAGVIWIDCKSRLPVTRLASMLAAGLGQSGREDKEAEEVDEKVKELLNRLTHFHAATIPHLIALLTPRSPTTTTTNNNPTQRTPPLLTIPSTPPPSLIILDHLPLLLQTSYPPSLSTTSRSNPPTRRTTTLHHLAHLLTSLSLTTTAAILLTSHTITRIRPNRPATLHPALGGSEGRERQIWEDAVGARVCLFRDWGVCGSGGEGGGGSGRGADNAKAGMEVVNARFAHVTGPGRREFDRSKSKGKGKGKSKGSSVGFDITHDGVAELPHLKRWSRSRHIPASSSGGGKRKREREEQEEQEEEKDEYGWPNSNPNSSLFDSEILASSEGLMVEEEEE
ncbi:MAG: hypothetical protein M1828_004759 [Chrysothrix sp. TS-e1954]|nr:MAG: hypothetical protein M1828_004759 [Chrysothrix sp. TS-e1954]